MLLQCSEGVRTSGEGRSLVARTQRQQVVVFRHQGSLLRRHHRRVCARPTGAPPPPRPRATTDHLHPGCVRARRDQVVGCADAAERPRRRDLRDLRAGRRCRPSWWRVATTISKRRCGLPPDAGRPVSSQLDPAATISFVSRTTRNTALVKADRPHRTRACRAALARSPPASNRASATAPPRWRLPRGALRRHREGERSARR